MPRFKGNKIELDVRISPEAFANIETQCGRTKTAVFISQFIEQQFNPTYIREIVTV